LAACVTEASAWAVAVTTSVAVGLGITVLGGVYTPVAAPIFPQAAPLHPFPETLHVTAVFVAPVDAALNGIVPESVTISGSGAVGLNLVMLIGREVTVIVEVAT
jgi:hypothetical protein